MGYSESESEIKWRMKYTEINGKMRSKPLFDEEVEEMYNDPQERERWSREQNIKKMKKSQLKELIKETLKDENDKITDQSLISFKELVKLAPKTSATDKGSFIGIIDEWYKLNNSNNKKYTIEEWVDNLAENLKVKLLD